MSSLPLMYPPNIKCPCGAGKKYKKCCAGMVYIDERILFSAENEHPGTIRSMIDALGEEFKMRGYAPDYLQEDMPS